MACRLGIVMKCDQCGAGLPHRTETCPSCGRDVSAITKTGDVLERKGEATVDLRKKVGKGAVSVGGRALSGLGSLAKKGGKKLQDAGEKK